MLPSDLIIAIICLLPRQQFYNLAVLFRFQHVRDKLIPLIKLADASNANIKGQLELLCWWQENQPYINTDEKIKLNLDVSSYHGHLHILDWWLKNKPSNIEAFWSVQSLDYASRYGNFTVLNWWKNSGLELKWSENATLWASKYGHLHVLHWWKNNGFKIKWSILALYIASQNGHVHVLDFWKNFPLIKDRSYIQEWGKYCGHEFLYLSKFAKNPAIFHIPVLEWFKNTRIYNIPNHAAKNEPLQILELWINGNLDHILDKASAAGHIHILNWCLTNIHIGLPYSCKAMNDASKNGHIHVLNWWKNSGLELKWSSSVMDTVRKVEILDWWYNSNMKTLCSINGIAMASNLRRYGRHIDIRNDYEKVYNWWKKHYQLIRVLNYEDKVLLELVLQESGQSE